MNKLRFIPAKDYDANRLTSGILQLPDRVHLVLDEMALQPGQLDVNGQYMLWMSSGAVLCLMMHIMMQINFFAITMDRK